MSVILNLPKIKCTNCDKFSPVTTKRGKDIIVGCACEKLCDSLEKLEKEKKEIEESPYISKWETVMNCEHPINRVDIPVTIPKIRYYHEGCPATDLRIIDIKTYPKEYTYCPDCGKLMIVPKYAEDIKP